MDDQQRNAIRELAQEHFDRGDVLGWFEALYAEAGEDASVIPWANLRPNLNLVRWLDRENPAAGRALVVGCGLGDDAEELSRRGFTVTAFDIAPTAIQWAKKRFPQSKVTYVVGDAIAPDPAWVNAFDFVFEAYTLQAILPEPRAKAFRGIASTVKPGGKLLVVCRGRDETDPPGNMPWPLTKAEVGTFETLGLKQVSFEDYLDEENPPVRRFRIMYRR